MTEMTDKLSELLESLNRHGCGAMAPTERRHLRDLCRLIADKLDPDAPPGGPIKVWGSQDE